MRFNSRPRLCPPVDDFSDCSKGLGLFQPRPLTVQQDEEYNTKNSMKTRTWHSLIVAGLLFCALPIDCHSGEHIVVPVATAQAAASAPSDNITDTGCVCQEDCFCCTLVVPKPVFELPHTLALVESAITECEPGGLLYRSTSIYHPPRA